MTNKKTNDEIVKPDAEETNDGKQGQEPNPKLEEVSKQIQGLLEENGLKLQPVLMYSPYGTIPQVQIVEIPEQEGTNEDK